MRPEDTGRFRDAFLQIHPVSGQVVIHVHTRNGGGNRSDYEKVTARLRLHPSYLEDYDEDYDRTYATYVFKFPLDLVTDEVRQMAAETLTPKAKFDAVMESLRKNR